MPFWESSTFWGVAGIVVGAAIATLFFFIGKSRKLLEYRISSTELISDYMARIPGIVITLDGQPINNLSTSTIKFLNTGNQTILSEDFATSSPICIKITDGQLFSSQGGYEITSDSKNSSSEVTFLDNTSLKIDFEFLKPKNAISLTILHSGYLSVSGELKDGEISKTRKRNGRVRDIMYMFAGTAVGVFLVIFTTPGVRNIFLFILFIVSFVLITLIIIALKIAYSLSHRKNNKRN